MTTNTKIVRPFKKSFGKDIYEEQKKSVNFHDGSLKKTIKKRGRI